MSFREFLLLLQGIYWGFRIVSRDLREFQKGFTKISGGFREIKEVSRRF